MLIARMFVTPFRAISSDKAWNARGDASIATICHSRDPHHGVAALMAIALFEGLACWSQRVVDNRVIRGSIWDSTASNALAARLQIRIGSQLLPDRRARH
jgi:hypothetical protein